jgi:hypothetical protein
MVLRVRRAAGLTDVRLHDLRHSLASVDAAGGLSLPVIGALLGHKHTATTARYAHLSADPLRAANDAVGARIAAAISRKEQPAPNIETLNQALAALFGDLRFASSLPHIGFCADMVAVAAAGGLGCRILIRHTEVRILRPNQRRPIRPPVVNSLAFRSLDLPFMSRLGGPSDGRVNGSRRLRGAPINRREATR